MPRHFPEWWDPSKKQCRMLFKKNILNTRDLIKAAHEVRTRVQSGDNEPITIAIDELFEFCNEHLTGLKLHVKTAHTEKHVFVTGRKPTTMISHIPDPIPEHTALDILPTLSSVSSVTQDPVTAYDWSEGDLNTFPPECYCPITADVFEYAVVIEDGFTYEKKAIMEWLSCHDTSPMTGETVSAKTFPNKVIMQLIRRLT
jgi:hypothetical protein